MKNRLVLMILLCSDMCYSLESNELDSVYEKENDLRGPCICTEYFWSWFNPAFYGSSKKSVKKAFFSAVKEGNIKVVRSIIFSSIDSIRYNDTDWSVMEWNNIKTIIRIICCRPIDSIRYNDTGGSSVIYWNNMKKEALKIAIEEGKPDIVKLLLMNCNNFLTNVRSSIQNGQALGEQDFNTLKEWLESFVVISKTLNGWTSLIVKIFIQDKQLSSIL